MARKIKDFITGEEITRDSAVAFTAESKGANGSVGYVSRETLERVSCETVIGIKHPDIKPDKTVIRHRFALEGEPTVEQLARLLYLHNGGRLSVNQTGVYFTTVKRTHLGQVRERCARTLTELPVMGVKVLLDIPAGWDANATSRLNSCMEIAGISARTRVRRGEQTIEFDGLPDAQSIEEVTDFLKTSVEAVVRMASAKNPRKVLTGLEARAQAFAMGETVAQLRGSKVGNDWIRGKK